MVGFIREAIEINSDLFVRLEKGPFDYFSMGGSLVIYVLFALVSALALLDGRLQIPIAVGLLIFQGATLAILGPVDSLYGFTSVSRNELELGIALWGPRLLFFSVIVSFILIFSRVVKNFSRKVDDWIAIRSPSALSEQNGTGAAAQTTSILAVVALLFSPFVPPLGIILGYVALNDIAVSAGTKRGKDMSVAAIVIGIVSIILVAILLVALWLGGIFLFVGPFAAEF